MNAGIAPDLASVTEPLAPSPAARRRGRKPGFRLPTFAQLDQLTLEDFSFVRGVYNGMQPRDAFLRFYANIHFAADGSPSIPHGLSVAARFKHLEAKIVEAAASSGEERLQKYVQTLTEDLPEQATDQAQRHTLEELFAQWCDNLPGDMYSESELPERFKEYLVENAIEVTAQQGNEVKRATMIDRRVKALNDLQTTLAYRPRHDAQTGIWLATPLRDALAELQVHTLGQLVGFISAAGRNWHRSVHGLGAVRAARLQAWLEDHAETLGGIRKNTVAWAPYRPLKSALEPLKRAPQVAMLEYQDKGPVATPSQALVLRAGIAPLELLQIPPELDGSHGTFRLDTPNHFGARTDLQAIMVWLATFHTAGKVRTFEAYRREAERFYIWCVKEAKVALSSVSTVHALDYQRFLARIPSSYISNARVTREDPRWRPWRGQLTPRSQAYALTVVKTMMESLQRAGYISGNAFSELKIRASADRSMDTSRSLSKEDLEWVGSIINKRLESSGDEPDAEGGLDRARRLRLILNMLLKTGLRLSELANARMRDLYRPQVTIDTLEGERMLRVVGKGGKERSVYIDPGLYAQIEAHQEDVERALGALHGTGSKEMLNWRIERPLIGRLGSAPMPQMTAADPKSTATRTGLGFQGIYKTLKAVFQGEAGRMLREIEHEVIRLERKREKARTGAQAEVFAYCAVELRRLASEKELWLRRQSFSTHWLRHTFAKEVLSSNPSDAGLKLAQQLLGHASISTTAVYLKQDDTEKLTGARLVFPKGI